MGRRGHRFFLGEGGVARWQVLEKRNLQILDLERLTSLCAGSWVNPSAQRKTFEFKLFEGRRLFEGGRLFRLSIFSLKMTLYFCLRPDCNINIPNCNIKIQKPYRKLLFANSRGYGGGTYLKGGSFYKS